MKQLKPRNSVLSFYTGTDGTYASVKPKDKSAARLQAYCLVATSMGHIGVISPLDLHTTVMYSKVGLNVDAQKTLWAEHYSVERVFAAKPKHFVHWAGHDDDGYIVLELESADLTELNTVLQKQFGLTSSFPDYRPHVTIVNKAYAKGGVELAQQTVDRLNGMRMPNTLLFTGLRVEDLA
jgi:hypothetical protein